MRFIWSLNRSLLRSSNVALDILINLENTEHFILIPYISRN